MIRYVVAFDVADFRHFDRWLFDIHSRESIQHFGSWLRRYESYRAYDAPPQADAFNVRRGRMTELWFDSVDAFVEARPFETPFTPYEPPTDNAGDLNAAITIVSATPTDDFLGIDPPAEGKEVVRWCTLFGYPGGVSLEEGDNWYISTHAQEARLATGLLRYVSYRQPDDSPLPTPYQRLTEIWFENLDAWKAAVLNGDFLSNMTPPPWDPAVGGIHSASIFLPRSPDVDFLRRTG